MKLFEVEMQNPSKGESDSTIPAHYALLTKKKNAICHLEENQLTALPHAESLKPKPSAPKVSHHRRTRLGQQLLQTPLARRIDRRPFLLICELPITDPHGGGARLATQALAPRHDEVKRPRSIAVGKA